MSAGAWWWREQRGGVALGFTARDIGNLATHVGDDPRTVRANRRVALDDLSALAERPPESVRPVFMDQVHGAAVRVLTRAEDVEQPAPASDAVVTTMPGVALFTLVADCTPVLLYDDSTGIIAAAHAGRPGMLAGVVPATTAAMRDLGADEITAVVGPSVCGRCYEVPDSMRDEAAAKEPVCAAVTWTGTSAIDVASGVVEQLRREQVALSWIGGCTREEPSLYSYRRDGRTGRFAGVIMLRGGGR